MAFGLPGWPGGDPDRLREAAKAWTTASSDLTSTVTTADGVVQREFAALHGQTKTAYLSVWNTYAGKERKAAEGATTVAEQVDKVAETIDEGHTRYKHIIAGLTAAAAVGVVVGFFTFGAGDLVVDSAAVGTAATAIAALLEWLGTTIEAAAIADVIGDMIVGALVGTEFSVFLQEGESLGAGDGLSVPDFSDTAVAALTGSLLGAASKAGEIVGDLKGLSASETLLLKGLSSAGLSAGGAITSSELDGKGLGDLEDVLLAAALGAGGAGLESSLAAAKGTIARISALGDDESRIAVDLAALYKEDPELLTAIRDDPYQSDDIRYMAGQYQQLFAHDAAILDHVPELATLLKQDPAEVTRVVQMNQELARIAHDVHVPHPVRYAVFRSLAHHSTEISVSFEGSNDEVRDWVKAHREVMEELEEKLKEVGE